MLGAPGAGKGTQAAALAKHFGVPHISTGELLRGEVAAGTALGQEVADRLAAGDLVPDELVGRVVAEALAQAGEGYILDGFPRTAAQAQAADERYGRLADAVVFLELPDDVAGRRLADRAEGRPDDRDPEVIAHRLRRYHDETLPLVDWYRGRAPVVTVDGDRPPDDVTAEALAGLEGLDRP